MPAELFGKINSPSGTIAYWDDDPANLPSGWVVCDGNNGTPNLLDQFVKNVPDSSTAPGSTGGQHSYTLSSSQLASHDHYTGSTDSAGSHDHLVFNDDPLDSNNTDNAYDYSDGAEDLGDSNQRGMQSAGGHSHSLNLGDTGSGNSIDSRPPFHELVPVMKT